jgi:glyoxylase-like metal-dependent hydrolase (beta-lactamase superfamily II)
MIFQQFRNKGCLSYLIGDEGTLECAVIDPAQDIGLYREAIETRGLRLIYVIETHSHADHITGASELAKKEKAIVLMNENVEKQRKISEGRGIKLELVMFLKKILL